MCGISVVLDPAAGADSIRLLARMHARVPHRGPDGEGHLRLDAGGRVERGERPPAPAPTRVGMAFRRLKVLDLTESAAQPMLSPEGRHALVFNGEIYNHAALRAELSAGGRRFASRGDAEVVLAAFEAWGTAAFDRLDGMWAIVVLDLPQRRLVASRDRFGIKPLYWANADGRLLLASEVKQVLAARDARPRAFAPLVADFLRGRRLPCREETFFEGVSPMPPGTWFEVPLDGPVPAEPRFRSYWQLADFTCDLSKVPSYADARDLLHATLERAVHSHLAADVPVGALLSGGLDSATLTALVPEERRATLPTVTFGLDDAPPELDELPCVNAMVRAHHLRNHRVGFDDAWLAASVPRMIAALEEPPLSPAAAAQFRVFEACRELGLVVVLDGQGADEIFAGYPYHQRFQLADRLRHGRVRAAADELRAIAQRHHSSRLRVLWDALAVPLLARSRDPLWIEPGYGSDAQRAALAGQRSRDTSLVNRKLHDDVVWGNVKIVLGYSDRNAMAHSVEARVPYFDRRSVELAFSLPDDYKLGGGDRKRILRDVARGVVPPEITERAERQGFALPEVRLLRGPKLAELIRSCVLDAGFRSVACLRADAVERYVTDFARGDNDDARGIWRLLGLALWRQTYDVALA